MANIKIKSLNKVYPNGFKAVHGIDLDIKDGEFMVFVGPSGCAKSTTLRMIAGLEDISSGEIYIGNRLVNDLPAKDRGIAMVFQNYALYPHMTAYQNIAFGLEVAKTDKEEIARRVYEAAEKLEITDLLDRRPADMSGGQRQRIAVGRAIVRKPQVFLFDEPLSNLDAKLRVSMRVRITQLHKELQAEGQNATMIYVTHDQTEAMTMGDRICVLNGGRIEQVDTPINLYNKPASKFVAGFIGSPAMNLTEVTIVSYEGGIGVQFKNGTICKLPESKARFLESRIGSKVHFGIRPEDISICDDSEVTGEVQVVEQMGNEQFVYFNFNNQQFIARIEPEYTDIDFGQTINLSLNLEKCHVFDFDTETNLTIPQRESALESAA